MWVPLGVTVVPANGGDVPGLILVQTGLPYLGGPDGDAALVRHSLCGQLVLLSNSMVTAIQSALMPETAPSKVISIYLCLQVAGKIYLQVAKKGSRLQRVFAGTPLASSTPEPSLLEGLFGSDSELIPMGFLGVTAQALSRPLDPFASAENASSEASPTDSGFDLVDEVQEKSD